jgi:hypothetical protein
MNPLQSTMGPYRLVKSPPIPWGAVSPVGNLFEGILLLTDCLDRRYIAAILWASDGEVHGGATGQVHCAYLQEEGNQELNRQQQPLADGPWHAVDHLCVGDASTPCGWRPLRASGLWPSFTLLDAPRCTPHAVRPMPYAPCSTPTPYAPRPMTYTVCPMPYTPRSHLLLAVN